MVHIGNFKDPKIQQLISDAIKLAMEIMDDLRKGKKNEDYPYW